MLLRALIGSALALGIAACGDGASKRSSNTGSGAAPRPAAAPTFAARPGCPDPADPKVFYTSQDVAFCATAKIACGSKQRAFNDACGCGCVDL